MGRVLGGDGGAGPGAALSLGIKLSRERGALGGILLWARKGPRRDRRDGRVPLRGDPPGPFFLDQLTHAEFFFRTS